MIAHIIPLLLFALLSACAPIYVSIYDEDRLDRKLSIPMSKEQVLDELGQPDVVHIDDGHTLVWEYNLYPRDATMHNLLAIPVYGMGLIFPVDKRTRTKWVVLSNGQLCQWGNPTVVATRKTCMGQPTASSTSAIKLQSSDETFTIQPIRVNAPPPIREEVKRVAVIHPATLPSLSSSFSGTMRQVVNQSLAAIRSRRPQLEVVERRDIDAAVNELQVQTSGLVKDQDVLTIGRMSAADHLLLYEVAATSDDELRLMASAGVVYATVSWKLLRVESGTVTYQEAVIQPIVLKAINTPRGFEELNRFREMAVALGFMGLYASLQQTFFPDDLGASVEFVQDERNLKVWFVLGRSSAERIGLKSDDRIIKIDGIPVMSAADAEKITPGIVSSITVKRGSSELELRLSK